MDRGDADAHAGPAGPGVRHHVDQLEFRAVQTYGDGQVVSWIEPTVEGQEEPQFPAPTLALVDAGEGGAEGVEAPHGDEASGVAEQTEATAPAAETNGGGNGLAVTALVVALLGLALGGTALALVLRRRDAGSPQTPG